MSRIQWKLARIFCIIAISVLFYLLLGIKSYSYRASFFLPNVPPNNVWEYVADFSNMVNLNPTIDDFKVIEESGNYNHWQYSVEYREHLSHWPYLPNYAKAQFDVKPNDQRSKFYITSIHTTCLMNDYLCLNSEGQFTFTNLGNSSTGTLCEEEITYQCPAIFARFCREEVKYQREEIMENLKTHFK